VGCPPPPSPRGRGSVLSRRRFARFTQLGQEIVQVLAAELVVLGEDALECAAAVALAIVRAAVEFGLERHAQREDAAA